MYASFIAAIDYTHVCRPQCMNNTSLVYSVPFGAAKRRSSPTHLVSIQYLIPHILMDQSQVILQFKNRKWMFC